MRVVWAMDGSEKAREAGRALARLVDPAASDLIALAVVPEDPLPWLEAPVLGVGHEIDAERRAALQAGLKDGIGELGWAVGRARARVESGDVARVIVAVAAEERADLVVIGAREHGYDDELIGPTCAEVLIRVGCPVWVVQEDRPWDNVLVATDGSETARAAEDFVARLAPRGALLHVRSVAAAKVPAGARPEDVPPLAEDEIARAAVEDAADRLAATGFTVTRVARPGRPADVLNAMAAEVDADVVVLGTHGLTGWRRAVLGSVAGEVARTSGVSVLVVPPAKRDA